MQTNADVPAAATAAFDVIQHIQESLGTIEATVQAALDADMPPSCKRTLYLCDDGKDKEKKAYIETLAHSGYSVE
jgi:hypothetical protein